MKFQIILIVLMFWLAACSQTEEAIPTPTTAVIANPEEITVPEPTQTLPNTPDVELVPTQVEVEPTDEPALMETAVPIIEPIEVTYFTPAQQEGPYYPVNKLEDRDNDLVELASAIDVPNGQILEFNGTVYDANGLPLEGLTVEIWQTDADGVYLHPNDPGTNNRDPNFQFYGETMTDTAGSYSFRTILPGLYEPRPRHIHVKVKLDGQELLTTQFYFMGEIDLQGDDAAMLIATAPAQDADGNAILTGQRDIILNFTQAN